MTDEAILRQYLEAERPLDPAKVTERAHLEREDGAWLEAFREGAIDALELATYRKEIKSKLRVLEQTQDADSYLPVEEYRYAAESMSLKELVDFASVTVIVQPDGVHIKLG